MTSFRFVLVATAALSALGCPRGNRSAAGTASSEGGPIALGAAAQGTFTPALPRDDLGKAHLDYVLTIEQAGTYSIELQSEDTAAYDPYLRLLRDGREIDRDDDGAEVPLQARIRRELEPGTYTVRVTKFGSLPVERPTGFTLLASRLEVPEAPGGGGRALRLGEPATGTFAALLPTDEAGIPYLDHVLIVERPGTYRIDLESADIRDYDPFLRLLRDGRELAADDDGGEAALQARIERELEPGAYTVRASRFGPGQVRSDVRYSLTVTRLGPEPDAGPEAPPPAPPAPPAS